MSSWNTREVRSHVKAALSAVREDVEKCRERALAITKLEEADMWLRVIYDRQQEAEQGADDIPF